MKELTEEEVASLIDAMRIRGELEFQSEDEIREACSYLSREELIDLICSFLMMRKREKELQ